MCDCWDTGVRFSLVELVEMESSLDSFYQGVNERRDGPLTCPGREGPVLLHVVLLEAKDGDVNSRRHKVKQMPH